MAVFRRAIWRRLGWWAAIPTVLAVLFGLLVVARASAGGASMVIEPSSQKVRVDQSEVSISVEIVNVENMASFEFTLRYDTGVLELVSAEADKAFISQAGEPLCPGPLVDEEHGRVTVGCATKPRGQQRPGVGGSGLLGVVTFRPRSVGKSAIVFTKASVSAWDATDIPVSVNQAVVRVVGEHESTGGPAEPTPTPDPRLLTPTPIPGAPTPEVLAAVDSARGAAVPTPGAQGRGAQEGRATGRGPSQDPLFTRSARGASEGFPTAGQGNRTPKQGPGWLDAVVQGLGVMGIAAVVGSHLRRTGRV